MNFSDKKKEYLGDGAYVELDASGCIVLTTHDGLRDTNTIVFEPEVLMAFEKWVAARRAEVSAWKAVDDE